VALGPTPPNPLGLGLPTLEFLMHFSAKGDAMHHRIRSAVSIFVCALLTVSASTLAAVEGYYRYPSIRGDKVVFTSEGDLWTVSATGGIATRLTSHPADEVLPKISPDGKWIAFTANYEGQANAYIMPIDSGEPRRMTFSPNTIVTGWSADSKMIYFRARPTGRDSEDFLYSLSLEGGEPEKLPLGTAADVSFSPDGKFAAFNRWLYNPAWKNYHGGEANQIWVGDLTTKKFTRLSPVEGINAYPMWIGKLIYFVAPAPKAKGGTLNIWSMNPTGGDVKPVTEFSDFDVRAPETDGKQIIFSKGADLWILNVADGSSHKIDIRLASDRIRIRPHVENASNTLDSFAIDKDGKHIAMSSRGQIWERGVKAGSRTITVADEPGVRNRSVVMSPDGKQIAAITDATGEQEIALFDVAGKQKPKVLTHNNKGWLFDPIWSADGKHIAYADLTMTLYVVDPVTGTTEVADKSENAEIREYAFSPDGAHLAYSKEGDNNCSEVWIYTLGTKQRHCISSGFTSDFSPAWDMSGKYLYFISSRYFNPMLDEVDFDFTVTKTQKICAALLGKDTKSPLLPDEVLDAGDDKKTDTGEHHKPATTRSTSGPATASTTRPTTRPTTVATTKAASKPTTSPAAAESIDFDGLETRMIELPIPPGDYNGLIATEGKVLFSSTEPHGILTPGGNITLDSFTIKDKKLQGLIDGIKGYALSDDGKVIAVQKDNDILIGSPDAGISQTEQRIQTAALPLMVDIRAEWTQIFADAWRLQRDFYFAQNMGGVDWNAMRVKYQALLPRVGHRNELNDLISQMQGELGTSHEYIGGGDFTYLAPAPIATGYLGATVTVDPKTGLHKLSRIYRPESWETDIEAPLAPGYLHVKEGDYLLAINGKDLAATDSVEEQLENLAGVEVLLTIASKADKSDAHDVEVKTVRSDFELRYRDWCRRNREYVEKKSGGKVGYFHVPDMEQDGLNRFVAGFFPQYKKEGLIIDARENHGGYVSQLMIERLARKHISYDRPRRGMMEDYPARASESYKCVLINEHAGSDGDIFPNAFKTLKLGPLIGVRTWGGTTGIRSDKPFVDGGMMTQPEFAWWSPTRGWGIENHGVDPDIEINYRPEDYLADRDPQLDRAIEEMLKDIAQRPVLPVTRPADPDHPGGK
jgi:tricorn protease